MDDAFESPATAASGGTEENFSPPGRSRTLPRRPRIREASEDEDDSEPGTWMVRADDLQEKAEDPAGLQRPADRDQQADAGELADALSELPEARLVRTSAAVSEVLAGADRYPAHRGARLEPSRAAWPIRSGTGGRELIGLAPRLCGSGWPRRGATCGWKPRCAGIRP
jgi:hypothetical protein